MGVCGQGPRGARVAGIGGGVEAGAGVCGRDGIRVAAEDEPRAGRPKERCGQGHVPMSPSVDCAR